MKNNELERLRLEIEELEDEASELEFTDLESRVNSIETKLRKLTNSNHFNEEDPDYEDLLEKIQCIKTDYDIEDNDEIGSTYDMMYPNRHDEDFDEDSMSYSSVFGDD